MPVRLNPWTKKLDFYGPIMAESDPVFSAWLLATPPLYPGGWYDAVQNTIKLSDFNDDLSYENPLTFSTGLTRLGDTITCDITQYTDAMAVSAIKADADWNATEWDTAYGWGNHAGLYWDNDADQTLLTGDKSGSFDLLTTGKGLFGSIATPLSTLGSVGQFVIGAPYAGDASLHITKIYGGNGRLSQMSPDGATQTSTDGKNLLGSTDGAGAVQWWTWGAKSSDNTFCINSGTSLGGGVSISSTNVLTAPNFVSNVATGTAPFACTSTTKNTNLNADQADGYDFNQDVRSTGQPTFNQTISYNKFIGRAAVTDYSHLFFQNSLTFNTSKTWAIGVARTADGDVNSLYFSNQSGIGSALHLSYSTNMATVQYLTVGQDNAALTPNIAGSIKMISAGDNAFYSTFTAGTQTANATYTLPTALPASIGFLKSTTAGVLSWDESTYLTAEADTLNSVTGRGATTANAITTGNITIGAGTAATDYTLTFDGETSDGVLTWLEDEKTLKLGSTGSGLWLDGTTGDTPTSGAGTRLMWIPAKGAFRAGYVDGTQWDAANIGNRSIGMGVNIIASGETSIGLGTNIVSSADYTFAAGSGATASALYAVAMGNTVVASQISAIAIGTNANATNTSALCLGGGALGSTASGQDSVTIGTGANASNTGAICVGSGTASGAFSIIVGNNCTASDTGSIAAGESCIAGSGYSFASGYFAETYGQGAVALGYFPIATGTGAFATGSAFTQYQIYAGTLNAGENFGQVAMGYVSDYDKTLKAEGNASMAFGQDINSLIAHNCIVMGKGFTSTMASSFGVGFDKLTLLVNQDEVDILNTDTLGTTKLTNGTFTGSATGWTVTNPPWAYGGGTVIKGDDGTGTLSQASASMVTPLVVGEIYVVSFTISATDVSGTLTVSCGGVTLDTFTVADGTFTTIPFKCSTTDDLTFTPDNDSRFRIDNITLKKVWNGKLTANGNIVGRGIFSTIDSATTNAVTDVMTLTSSTTGTAADNIGTGLVFKTEDASKNIEEIANIDAVNTTAAHATQVSVLNFGILGTNQIRLTDGTLQPVTTNDIDLGTSALLFKNEYLSGKMLSYNNVATEGYGVPAIVDHVALTGQGASIGTTNFTNAGTAGLYRVNYYLEATTLNAGATSVLATFSWTDDAGATTVVSSALPLTALGRTSGIFYVQLASGNLTYATTYVDVTGLSRYALYCSCERLN